MRSILAMLVLSVIAAIAFAPTRSSAYAATPTEYAQGQLQAAQAAFGRCYQRHLARVPREDAVPAATRVQLAFTLVPSGEFTNVRLVDSPIRDFALSECIVQVVRGLHVPVFRGAAIPLRSELVLAP